MGFSCAFAVPSTGRSGGLAMMWMDSEDMELIQYFRNHIDMVVMDRKLQRMWRLNWFSRTSRKGVKAESWKLLSRLKDW